MYNVISNAGEQMKKVKLIFRSVYDGSVVFKSIRVDRRGADKIISVYRDVGEEGGISRVHFKVRTWWGGERGIQLNNEALKHLVIEHTYV